MNLLAVDDHADLDRSGSAEFLEPAVQGDMAAFPPAGIRLEFDNLQCLFGRRGKDERLSPITPRGPGRND
jgi:hypothetical protein